MNAPRAGQPAQPSDLVDVAALVTAYYTRAARPGQRRRAGRVRHLGPPRLEPADRRSTRRTSRRPPRRSASTARAQGIDGPLFIGRDTHGAVRAGLDDRARGARGQRRHRARRLGRRLHADARRSRTRSSPPTGARSPASTEPAPPARRRHRRHPVAQPAPRRRLQVQPAARRPGRLRRHQVDRRPRQRADPRRAGRGQAGAVRAGPAPRHPATTSSAPTSPTWRTSSTSTRSARPGCASAPTRSAARPSTTGAPSASATGSTSPS